VRDTPSIEVHLNAEVRVPYEATYAFYAFDGEPLPWMILGGN